MPVTPPSPDVVLTEPVEVFPLGLTLEVIKELAEEDGGAHAAVGCHCELPSSILQGAPHFQNLFQTWKDTPFRQRLHWCQPLKVETALEKQRKARPPLRQEGQSANSGRAEVKPWGSKEPCRGRQAGPSQVLSYLSFWENEKCILLCSDVIVFFSESSSNT